MLIFEKITTLISMPILFILEVIGMRENCLELEFLTRFKPGGIGFKNEELSRFHYSCKQLRAMPGESYLLTKINTPEESDACERDWLKLIEEAKRQREKQLKIPFTSSPLSYLSAMVVGNNIHSYNNMIDLFQEQLEIVRECRIKRTVIDVADPKSSDQWVVIHKNEMPTSVKLQYWMDKSKEDEVPQEFQFFEETRTPIENVGIGRPKTKTLSKNGKQYLREVEVVPAPEVVAVLIQFKDGKMEELPLP